MWPLDRRNEAVLRIARDRIELWDMRAGEQTAGAPIEPACNADALEQAISDLLAAQQPPVSRIHVVVESAWSPVLSLPAGPWRWNLATQLAGLLRHRLEALYGDGADPVGSWILQVDYRPGDATALGYALPRSLQAAIERAAQRNATTVRALQPAFAWGRATAAAALPRKGWWLWLEQERIFVAYLDRGQITALQPAAPPLSTGDEVRRLVRAEALRFGLEEGVEPVAVSGWRQPTSLPATATWVPVTATRPLRGPRQPAETTS